MAVVLKTPLALAAVQMESRKKTYFTPFA